MTRGQDRTTNRHRRPLELRLPLQHWRIFPPPRFPAETASKLSTTPGSTWSSHPIRAWWRTMKKKSRNKNPILNDLVICLPSRWHSWHIPSFQCASNAPLIFGRTWFPPSKPRPIATISHFQPQIRLEVKSYGRLFVQLPKLWRLFLQVFLDWMTHLRNKTFYVTHGPNTNRHDFLT